MNPSISKTVQPQGCTNLKLRQLTRRVTQLYDARVGKSGLKTTQFSLLTAVERMGPLQPGALARTLGLQASTLTRNLKPLLAAGLLHLGPGADGRSRLVEITDAGRAKRAEAKSMWKSAQIELNQILGEERVAALHAWIDESLALLAPVATEEDSDED